MDQDRLREVQRTDTTREGRLNEDFVEWLKTKGPSWLLMFMIIVVAYLVMVKWRESRVVHRAQAWVQYQEAAAGLPGGLEAVADQYPDVDSVALLARLRAAQQLLHAVQVGRPVDAAAARFDPEDAAALELTDEERRQYLDRAERAYRKVLDGDDGSAGMTLHAVAALNGLAAVAEARGEFDDARRLYEQAAERAGDRYPALAEQARRRADTAERQTELIVFRPRPVEDDPTPLRGLDPATLDPALIDLLLEGERPLGLQ